MSWEGIFVLRLMNLFIEEMYLSFIRKELFINVWVKFFLNKGLYLLDKCVILSVYLKDYKLGLIVVDI